MLFVPSGLLVSRSFSFFRPGSCSCDLRGCHEPRIEPWLTPSTTLACRSLNSMELPPVAEKLMRIKRQNPCSEADGKWAGSRETNLDSGRGRTFFLDIPLYRWDEKVDPRSRM